MQDWRFLERPAAGHKEGSDLPAKPLHFILQDGEEALVGSEQESDMVMLYLRVITLASEQRTEWREWSGKDSAGP